jgi:hypothetical protein
MNAGVAGVGGGIGLDRVVGHPADNPGGDRALEAVGATNEQQLVARKRGEVEASDRTAGSWPRYYDSLRAFSPAAFSSMPGMRFPGDPDHYPARDEVGDYLERYAATLDAEIRIETRVMTISKTGGSSSCTPLTGSSCTRRGSSQPAARSRILIARSFRGGLHGRALARRQLPQPDPVHRQAGDHRRRRRLGGPGCERARAGRDRHAGHTSSGAAHSPAAWWQGRPLPAARDRL